MEQLCLGRWFPFDDDMVEVLQRGVSEEPWCILCTHWDYGTIAEAMRIEDEEEEGEQEMKLLHCCSRVCSTNP